jgi:hypothetical protein
MARRNGFMQSLLRMFNAARESQRAGFLYCSAYIFAALAPLAWLVPTTGWAQTDTVTCNAGGTGTYCTSSDDCAANRSATACVAHQCEIPCNDEYGERLPSACALGETCVYGETESGPTHYCQPSSFAMDLNLLDSCITHFIDGLRPDLSGDNTCSLEQALGLMLDQDNNKAFNIFDVDLCIKTYLGRKPCDPDTGTCPARQVYCAEDADCGASLYCNLELHQCERECGLIANREDGTLDWLDRQCTRPLTVCNYDRGRCEPVELEGLTCQVNRDCPAGAVCSMGECVPKCYRSLDCPDSGWYCGSSNRCLPKPSPDAEDGFVFDPQAYSIQFSRKNLALSAIDNEDSVPLLILNLQTKKQEFDNPAVVFGYRLEVSYSRKQDSKCLKPADQWSEAEREDCLIDATEEFVTLLNPFGTVYAAGSSGIDLSLNEAAAAELSTGLYRATVTAYFNNGAQDSATVSYRKSSPSGEYNGRLSIYLDDPTNLLGSTNVAAQLYVDNDPNATIEWQQLLADQNLDGEEDLHDITTGFRVTGYLHGNDSMVFNLPQALTRGENEIPVRGIYAPHLGRMRLVGVIELEADYCNSDQGECSQPAQPGELQAKNPFGRKIRRLFELVGPFDERSHRFHGMYRETISGLGPAPITFDGGFQLDQWRSDETPIPYDKEPPLLAADAESTVQFPATADLVTVLDRPATDSDPGGKIQQYCGAADQLELYDKYFANAGAYASYLDSYCAPDSEHSGYCDTEKGRNEILDSMVRFHDSVKTALDGLGQKNPDMLTINDFLRGQIVLCSQDPNAENCINENEVRCGLALFRRAMLGGWEWVNLQELGPVYPRRHTLFCSEAQFQAGEPNGCQLDPSVFPTVISLQEHNRFYKELTQALKYQAGNDLSDAFFVLYRNAAGQLEQYEALTTKQTKLFSAWDTYNALLAEMTSPVSTKVLFEWPMSSFETLGKTWLGQMHSVASDRMDALAEIIDLKRRLLITAEDQDFVFIQHLMQMEYLAQAYLLGLQKAWEEESFAYEGQGPEALEQGRAILQKVNDSRNPLGLFPRQIFFENSTLGIDNWKNYRKQILEGPPGAGLLGEVEAAIDGAVANLRGALADEATFDTQILQARHQFEQEVDSLCGEDLPIDPSEGYCEVLDEDQRELEASCEGEDCLYSYRCEDSACDKVVKAFKEATGEGLSGTACDLSTDEYPLQVGDAPRQCVRGQMGTLLQEREQLRLQREQVLKKVNGLLRQIASQTQYMRDTASQNEDLDAFLIAYNAEMLLLEEGVIAAEAAYATAEAAAEASDCWVVAGTANGTNCPQKVAKAGAVGSAVTAKFSVVSQMKVAQGASMRLKESVLFFASQNAEMRRQKMALDNLTTEVENYVAEYEMLTQSLFNLNVRIDDTYYLAKRAADRYTEHIGNIVDHLIGGESGNILLRNQYVQTANARFHDLLVATYKMAMAFIHSYNLKDQSVQITNRVFQIMTPADVRDFVRELDVFELSYCGGAGIDCDSVHNTEHFRFSMREELFPSLRDIVDPRSGAVLTKGEQFHNIITSGEFLHKRERAGRVVRQIELPFAIWLNDRGDSSAFVEPWMVSPLECNHIIVGNGNGTMGVNLVGTRLRNLTYEIWRGNTDYIRACEPQEVIDSAGNVELAYPINSFMVGYAPQNSLAQEDVPPAYSSHSPGFLACKNVPELGGDYITDENCFNYFARDRSLGAPDWKLVVPLDIGYGNEWIFGDNNPIVEDIVLYFRYRTRPVQ